jgi:hypothetical protein
MQRRAASRKQKRARPQRDWFDYLMLAVATASLFVGVWQGRDKGAPVAPIIIVEVRGRALASPPKVLKPARRQFGIAHRRLD